MQILTWTADLGEIEHYIPVPDRGPNITIYEDRSWAGYKERWLKYLIFTLMCILITIPIILTAEWLKHTAVADEEHSRQYRNILKYLPITLNEEQQAHLFDLKIEWKKECPTVLVNLKVLYFRIEVFLKQLIDKSNPFKSKTPEQ